MIKCPTCKKLNVAEEAPFWPFCSERCKLVDLGQWFEEGYKVTEPIKPGEPTAEELSD